MKIRQFLNSWVTCWFSKSRQRAWSLFAFAIVGFLFFSNWSYLNNNFTFGASLSEPSSQSDIDSHDTQTSSTNQKYLAKQIAPSRNAIILVADGLRRGSINFSETPTIASIRQKGVNFVNSHALFPTFTSVNAAAIATGYHISNPDNLLNKKTLLEYARENGYNTASVGKLGPTAVQDFTQANQARNGIIPKTIIIDDSTGRDGGLPLNPEIAQGLTSAGLPLQAPDRSNGFPDRNQLNNNFSGNNTTAGTLAANIVQQKYFTDVITKVILPKFVKDRKPFALVYWSRDPDGTYLNQGDSLNHLSPGINGSTSKAAVKNLDNNLYQILDFLKNKPKIAQNTDIFIISDHGFSTISKQFVDNKGTKVSDYAASLQYTGVNRGFLPPGFVSIDIAHNLGFQLYDFDTKTLDGKYSLVNPTQGQYPKLGNGLIGGTGGQVFGIPDAKVIVVASGGSDLIYIPSRDLAITQKVVDFLVKQDYTSGLFVDDNLGSIPGTLPLSAINLKDSINPNTPSIILNFKTFSTDTNRPFQSQVEIADTVFQQGQGMHGGFGQGDTLNTMLAIGPDFKRGYTDFAPVSNADVTVTLAHLLGFKVSLQGNLVGRVITEALVGSSDSVPFTRKTLRSQTTVDGMRTYLNYQEMSDGFRYFDSAGFPGRTVGLFASKDEKFR